MTRREFYLGAVLISLSAVAWYWAGWAAGRSKYETFRSMGCRFTCSQTITPEPPPPPPEPVPKGVRT